MTLPFGPLGILVSRAWQEARGEPRRFVYIGLFLVAQALALAEPFVIGRMLDTAQLAAAGTAAVRDIGHWAFLYFALQIGFWVFHGPGRVMESVTAFDLHARSRLGFFRRVLDLPVGWHRDHHSGATLSCVGRTTRALREFVDSGFNVFYMISRLVGSLVVLTWLMPAAGLLAVVTAVTCLFVTSRLDDWLSRLYARVYAFEDRVATGMQDYLGNVVTLLNLRLEDRAAAEMESRLQAPRDLTRQAAVINELKWFTMSFFMAGMIAAGVVLYVTHEARSGRVPGVGTLYALVEYLRKIGNSFRDFGGLYAALVQHSVGIQSADPIVEAHRAHAALTASRLATTRTTWSTLRLDGTRFHYPGAAAGEENRQLDVTSLTLSRGRHLALVGASGSGKSTLLKVLRGLETADSASLAIDGGPSREHSGPLDLAATLLPQDPEIFSNTVRYNVAFGLEAEEDRLREALDLAGFTPVLERLPDGLDTHLAERGVNLSGGEKQRLALARGLYFARGSALILLDESTSSVDSLTERQIFARLLERFREETVVSAIHRLHLTALFDEVLVLEGGHVVQHGTFHELCAREGLFQELWIHYQATNPG